MKSDHRHELKTNELADWLMHFPEWAKENRTTLIAAGAIVIVALGVYIVRSYRGDSAATQSQVQLTTLVGRLAQEKAIAAQSPEKYLGFATIATDLKDFADRVGGEMAAFALIKRGEALRAELHFGSSQVSPDDAAKQMDQAKQSYTQALQLAASAPSLASAAQFGLGLCEEELGNLDKAKEIYHEMAKKPDYEGTAGRAAAVSRVKTVDEYKSIVVFKPAPPPKPVAASSPRVLQIQPGDANAPIVIPISTPNNVTVRPATPKTTPESNSVSRTNTASPSTTAKPPAEANQPAGSVKTVP